MWLLHPSQSCTSHTWTAKHDASNHRQSQLRYIYLCFIIDNQFRTSSHVLPHLDIIKIMQNNEKYYLYITSATVCQYTNIGYNNNNTAVMQETYNRKDIYEKYVGFFALSSVQIFNWEKLEPGGTQTHVSHKLGECPNH